MLRRGEGWVCLCVIVGVQTNAPTKRRAVRLHCSLGVREISLSCQSGVCTARRAETTPAVFTRTQDETYSGFSVLSQNGGPRRSKTLTGSICLRARSGTFPNGRLRLGLRLWIVLTSKSARRLESLESAIISVLAIECCPSSLIQPPCEFWHLPMKRGTLYKRTVSSVSAVFSSQALSRPLRANCYPTRRPTGR